LEDSVIDIPRKAHRYKDRIARELRTRRVPSKTTPLSSPAQPPTPVEVPEGEEREIVKAHLARSMPPGLNSLGIRALHLRVHVGGPDATPIRGRLDSGADLTLMSEDYFNSIPGLPKPREGLRMQLYVLTRQAKVLGYTRFTMYVLSATGVLVSFEVEAYVVRNMRVPLLLGEDFQISYELGVTRYSNGHCDVRIGQSDLVLPGSSAQ
jgi:hypothetical protein